LDNKGLEIKAQFLCDQGSGWM